MRKSSHFSFSNKAILKTNFQPTVVNQAHCLRFHSWCKQISNNGLVYEDLQENERNENAFHNSVVKLKNISFRLVFVFVGTTRSRNLNGNEIASCIMLWWVSTVKPDSTETYYNHVFELYIAFVNPFYWQVVLSCAALHRCTRQCIILEKGEKEAGFECFSL